MRVIYNFLCDELICVPFLHVMSLDINILIKSKFILNDIKSIKIIVLKIIRLLYKKLYC